MVKPVKNMTTEAAKMDPNRVMPPVNNGQKTYTFDQDATKKAAEAKA